MAYPPKPQIQTSYTAVEQALGDGTLPGQELDNDFANLKFSVDALNDFVRGLARSDGRLGNGTVTRDSLAADILLGLAPPEPWQPGRDYEPPDTVFESNKFYLAQTAHTSTTFAADLAAGRWVELADFTAIQAASIAAQQAAEAARDDAETARDDVLLRYLGAFPAPPTAPQFTLVDGVLYFDTTLQAMFVYNGTAWSAVSSAVAGVRNQFLYVAAAGQTVFSGPDIDGDTPVFGSANLVSVYLNGIRLAAPADYTINVPGGSITLTSPAALNDVVEFEVFGNFSAQPPEAAQVLNLTINGTTFTGQATQPEAEAGVASDRLMTPLRTAQSIAVRSVPLARTINTTAPLTGGGALDQNRTFGINLASQAQAEAGSANNVVMTPLRVAQAIASLANAWVFTGTAVLAGSSSHLITGIPTSATEIEIELANIGGFTSQTTINIQIGNGAVETTGYNAFSSAISASVGTFHSNSHFPFYIVNTWQPMNGMMRLRRAQGNSWYAEHFAAGASTGGVTGGGRSSVNTGLDRVQITNLPGISTWTGTVRVRAR